MKNFILILLVLLSMFSISSCKKKNTQVDYNQNVNTSKDFIFIEDLYIEIFNLYFKAIHNQDLLSGQEVKIDACEISYDADMNIITFSYGYNPAWCPDNKTRQGWYYANFDGPVNEQGTSALITFDSLHVNESTIHGYARTEHLGKNGENKTIHSYDVVGGYVIIADSVEYRTIEIDWEYEMSWEQGESTPDIPEDDLLLINGNSSGKSQDGLIFNNSIGSSLHNYIDCFWIHSGVHLMDIPGIGTPEGQVDYILEDECFYRVAFYFNDLLFYDDQDF